MKTDQLKALLHDQFGASLQLTECLPAGLTRVHFSMFHEDGDGVSIYVKAPTEPGGKWRVTDCGDTLMHLSMDGEYDTPARLQMITYILMRNQAQENDGEYFIEADKVDLFKAIMQFAWTVGKISAMSDYLPREETAE
jgi:hypothetical protein